MDVQIALKRNELIILDLTKFTNLRVRGVPVDPDQAAQMINTNLMAEYLAKAENCTQAWKERFEQAAIYALKTQNPKVQTKMALALEKISEIEAILADKEIFDLIATVDQEPDF